MNLTIDGPTLVIKADHKWPSLQLAPPPAQTLLKAVGQDFQVVYKV